MRIVLAQMFLFTIVVAVLGANAQEPVNPEMNDLSEEIAARTIDIDRTNKRIKQLSEDRLRAISQKKTIEKSMDEIEARLVAKTSILYRMSRHGKALRYLFTSETPTDFFKRMQTLRRLLEMDLKAKRAAGLDMENNTAEMNQALANLKHAEALLQALEETKQELVTEQQLFLESSI